MVQEVQNLNKRIEAINVQRTKSETRMDMLKKQLAAEISAYKKQYGVDLYDKNFKKLKANVAAEFKKVSSEVESEYSLKIKVVSAIENGDYAEAYKLLGIETTENIESAEEAEGTEETEGTEGLEEGAVAEEVEEAEEAEEADFDFGFEDSSEEPEAEGTESVSGTMVDDELDFGFELEEKVEINKKPAKTETKKPAPAKKAVSGQSAVDAVQSMGADDFDLVLEDDEDLPDLGDADWGFGELTKGSKFAGGN